MPKTSHVLQTSDHPRVCGEHLIRHLSTHNSHGSSPRVRGTRPSSIPCALPARIIPACAGNTPPAIRATTSSADHPRVCGEHRGCKAICLSLRGSSPRVRGTLERAAGVCVKVRIIPACAGNTAVSITRRRVRSDHPRVCGEHDLHQLPVHFGFGSSPRVRGTPDAVPEVNDRVRIIPACAGNTDSPPVNT